MKSIVKELIIAFAASLVLINPANSQGAQEKSQSNNIPLPDSVFFHSLVGQYAQSVDQADTTLAKKIWAPTAEISFINSGGTGYGWNDVKNIYKIFKDKFSVRRLSFSDIKFAYYGNVSWLTFNWIFDAKLTLNDNPVQTKGCETQIWRKINYEWRLVHVHYSEMPVTVNNQSF